jgi:four helix bundle protein
VFDYRDLTVWWKAREVVVSTYELTRQYPAAERFGLTAQTRRAAVSVVANLAEGCGRRGKGELARFVDIATGSAYELECHLLLAHDLGFLSDDGWEGISADVDEVKRMLIGLSRSLRQA